VCLYPEGGFDADSLVKNADSAMYRAKQESGDCVRAYQPGMDVEAAERLTVESNLRRAMEQFPIPGVTAGAVRQCPGTPPAG
jgi:polar amino acid transport system substrate-binding protein